MRDKIFGCIQEHNTFVVAYSGGLDSHVLLHIMAQLQAEHADIRVQAVHVNHQLNSLSNTWAQHCHTVCTALNIPIFIEKIKLQVKPRDSLEEIARDARYAIFKQYLAKNSVLLTAHHLNDQAETFLLQALRGAGPKGLSAMPVTKKWGEGILMRPLLSFSRDELAAYAHTHQLQWIDDDSNTNPRFRRNFLRHHIFPLLKKEYPAVMKNFSRSAQLTASSEKIVQAVVKNDFDTIKTDDVAKIDLKKLREFPEEKQKLLLREWFSRNQLRMPSSKHLQQLLRDVVHAGPEAKPVFALKTWSVRRDRVFLYFLPQCK